MGIFDKKPVDAEIKPGEEKPPEKTAAELIADALKPLVDAQAAINQKVDAFIESNKKKEPAPPPPDAPVSVLDDENTAFNQRLGPIAMRQLELEARIVKGDIRNEYSRAGFGDLWEQYQKDIDGALDSSPLVDGGGKILRGDPVYIRNVVDMIFGRAARQSGMRFDGKNKSFFVETAGGEGSNARVAPEADGLTDSQRKVIQRMNIPLDKAKETIKKLQFIS